MSFARAIATVGGLTLVSRFLGFLRDALIAAALGAGPVADAFVIAMKFPNFFRRLFGEGAFAAAFVPTFNGILATRGRLAAIAFAESALAGQLATLLFFTILAVAGMPWLMYGLAPGFVGDPVRFPLAVELTRITFPYLLFLSVAALYTSVLNGFERYSAGAATPILLNLVFIAALLTLADKMTTPGHALAWGLYAAGVVQFLFLAVACRRAGAGLRLIRPRRSPEVQKMTRLMLPVAIGAGVTQVNLMVDVMIASFLPDGAVSYLYFADRVAQLPLGVVGAAIATVLLPTLTRQIKSGADDEAMASQNRAIELALALALPASIGAMLLARPIVSTLFEYGAFTAEASRATAAALVAFGAGIPATVLIKALTPGFFAREDTATPVKIAVVTLVLNVVLNLILMRTALAHAGIALATSLAAWVNTLLLGWLLHRRGHLALDDRLARRAPRLFLCSLLMAAALIAAPLLMPPLPGTGTLIRILVLVWLIGVGAAVYFGAAHLTGAIGFGELKSMLRRRRA